MMAASENSNHQSIQADDGSVETNDSVVEATPPTIPSGTDDSNNNKDALRRRRLKAVAEAASKWQREAFYLATAVAVALVLVTCIHLYRLNHRVAADSSTVIEEDDQEEDAWQVVREPLVINGWVESMQLDATAETLLLVVGTAREASEEENVKVQVVRLNDNDASSSSEPLEPANSRATSVSALASPGHVVAVADTFGEVHIWTVNNNDSSNQEWNWQGTEHVLGGGEFGYASIPTVHQLAWNAAGSLLAVSHHSQIQTYQVEETLDDTTHTLAWIPLARPLVTTTETPMALSGNGLTLVTREAPAHNGLGLDGIEQDRIRRYEYDAPTQEWVVSGTPLRLSTATQGSEQGLLAVTEDGNTCAVSLSATTVAVYTYQPVDDAWTQVGSTLTTTAAAAATLDASVIRQVALSQDGIVLALLEQDTANQPQESGGLVQTFVWQSNDWMALGRPRPARAMSLSADGKHLALAAASQKDDDDASEIQVYTHIQ